MFMKLQNRKGFTLVELMIVVAIIGILAAIAIPAFLRSIKKSKTSEAEGIMRKMADGSKSYFTSEQKFSESVTNGGVEPWHEGTPAGATAFGLPVPWDQYVFPGGDAFQFNTWSGDGSTATQAEAPTGGSKMQSFQGVQPLAGSDLNAALNRLNVSFTDPTYFLYGYSSTGVAQAAAVQVLAIADFKDAGDAHTITQNIAVDPTSQEVLINPAFTTYEYE